MNSTPAKPIDFYCGFHLHQPVGNFGDVIEQHVRDVYRPLIAQLTRRPEWPVIVHVSGALLEWCEQNDRALIDDLARIASDGRAEFLLAGFYEPVLASLPREDRLTQIRWLREWLLSNMGVAGDGLWLTERVWEPDLASDLADAGVRYALVDDRHFLVSGHTRDAMSAVFRTEHDGRYLDLLPISEKLRYLIPFRPVDEIVQYLRDERDAGRHVAIFADDGEKFGGWPNTHEWVFGGGWLEQFIDRMADLHASGELRLVTGTELLRTGHRGGLAYLGNASYREMEEWSLPTELGVRHAALTRELGEARMASEDSAFIRGAHWKHFLVKYPEANRAHKHMLALSALCRKRGDPEEARREIGRGQSNDSLWHGVFGGLYLPWLREAVWQHLAHAEALLRVGESLVVEQHDHDGDGRDEIWVHGEHVSVVMAPRRGAAIELWMLLDRQENAADALTRRVEAYHHLAVEMYARQQLSSTAEVHHASDDANGAPSIHEIEQRNTLAALPPADIEVRSLLQVRIVDGALTEETWRAAAYLPVRSYASRELTVDHIEEGDEAVVLTCSGDDGYRITTTIHANGSLDFHVEWKTLGLPIDAQCAIELSLAPRTQVEAQCDNARITWRGPIETIAKSEAGLERTVQGQALLFLIPIASGRTSVALRPVGIDPVS